MKNCFPTYALDFRQIYLLEVWNTMEKGTTEMQHWCRSLEVLTQCLILLCDGVRCHMLQFAVFFHPVFNKHFVGRAGILLMFEERLGFSWPLWNKSPRENHITFLSPTFLYPLNNIKNNIEGRLLREP